MVMNFRRSRGHRATNIFNLQPGRSGGCLKFAWGLKFGHDANRPLLDHLRNELVRIKQLTAHGYKQTTRTGAPRIVSNVGYDGTLLAG
jgi:hypothetical protein